MRYWLLSLQNIHAVWKEIYHFTLIDSSSPAPSWVGKPIGSVKDTWMPNSEGLLKQGGVCPSFEFLRLLKPSKTQFGAIITPRWLTWKNFRWDRSLLWPFFKELAKARLTHSKAKVHPGAAWGKPGFVQPSLCMHLRRPWLPRVASFGSICQVNVPEARLVWGISVFFYSNWSWLDLYLPCEFRVSRI